MGGCNSKKSKKKYKPSQVESTGDVEDKSNANPRMDSISSERKVNTSRNKEGGKELSGSVKREQLQDDEEGNLTLVDLDESQGAGAGKTRTGSYVGTIGSPQDTTKTDQHHTVIKKLDLNKIKSPTRKESDLMSPTGGGAGGLSTAAMTTPTNRGTTRSPVSDGGLTKTDKILHIPLSSTNRTNHGRVNSEGNRSGKYIGSPSYRVLVHEFSEKFKMEELDEGEEEEGQGHESANKGYRSPKSFRDAFDCEGASPIAGNNSGNKLNLDDLEELLDNTQDDLREEDRGKSTLGVRHDIHPQTTKSLAAIDTSFNFPGDQTNRRNALNQSMNTGRLLNSPQSFNGSVVYDMKKIQTSPGRSDGTLAVKQSPAVDLFLTPERLKQRQEMFNSKEMEDFKMIDMMAAKFSFTDNTSPEKIAKGLIRGTSSSLQKVRLIYRWITHHIEFDMTRMLPERTKSRMMSSKSTSKLLAFPVSDPSAILKNRVAEAEGYCQLCKAMLQSIGFNCRIIFGFAKDNSYDPYQNFSVTNHNWNAVEVDGNWYFLDCTWGAGYVKKHSFYKRFDPHYFMTIPEEFIFDHFPENPDWQMMKEKLKMANFLNLPILKSHFFEYGMELVSHKELYLESFQSKMTLEFNGLPGVQVISKLEEKVGEGPASTGRILEYFNFVQRNEEKIYVTVVFPKAKEFRLSLYAKPYKVQNADFKYCLSYIVKAKAAAPKNLSCPQATLTFTESASFLFSPLEGTLRANVSEYFKIRVPGAVVVAVQSDGKWFYLRKIDDDSEGDDVFEGQVSVGIQTLKVVCKFSTKTTTFENLVTYDIVPDETWEGRPNRFF